ncbi:hypothetical protein RBB50_011796 [Rhinocladiella similis]
MAALVKRSSAVNLSPSDLKHDYLWDKKHWSQACEISKKAWRSWLEDFNTELPTLGHFRHPI